MWSEHPKTKRLSKSTPFVFLRFLSFCFFSPFAEAALSTSCVNPSPPHLGGDLNARLGVRLQLRASREERLASTAARVGRAGSRGIAFCQLEALYGVWFLKRKMLVDNNEFFFHGVGSDDVIQISNVLPASDGAPPPLLAALLEPFKSPTFCIKTSLKHENPMFFPWKPPTCLAFEMENPSQDTLGVLHAKLPLDLCHHFSGCLADGLHRQGGEPIRNHAANDQEGKGGGLQDVHTRLHLVVLFFQRSFLMGFNCFLMFRLMVFWCLGCTHERTLHAITSFLSLAKLRRFYLLLVPSSSFQETRSNDLRSFRPQGLISSRIPRKARGTSIWHMACHQNKTSMKGQRHAHGLWEEGQGSPNFAGPQSHSTA